jgi:hypothetical protein
VKPGAPLRALAATPEGVEITCSGRSMEPTLRAGDRVRVRSGTPIRAGDVVLLENADGDGAVLHRVLALLPGTPWFLHGGDAGRHGGAGLARRDRIIGRALLPRRRPPLAAYVAATTATVALLRRRARRV